MREKLVIANQMRVSRKSFSNNSGHKKLCSKCYRTYVVECIIKGKKEFKISFEGQYNKSLKKRILDWILYIKDSIYCLMHFTPKTYRPLKPIHIKIAWTPNEDVLYKFLEINGFKVVDEHLYSESTVYDVAKI